MKRKVVQQGVATLMVSLPASWTKKNKVVKGDSVEISEVEDCLVVTKDRTNQRKKTTRIRLKEFQESSIRTAIVNSYRAGYDRVEIHFIDNEQYKIIQETVQKYLIGFQVIKKEKFSCVVENITEPSEEQFEVILDKIFYNISSLINNTQQRVQGEKFDDYKSIVFQTHQYDNFCRRVISKTNKFGSKNTLFWTFLTLLIHGQRELYHLNRYLDKNKIRFKEKEVFEDLNKIFLLLEEAYKEKNIQKIEKLHDLEKKVIYKRAYSNLNVPKKDKIILHHTILAIKNFYLASSPLLGVLL